jgi:hypothetical protein
MKVKTPNIYIIPKVVEQKIKPNYFFSHVNLVDGFNVYGNVLAQYDNYSQGTYECCCGDVTS